MRRKEYEREMRRLHGELVAMQEWVKASGAKICIVFEGRDTAGKGGTIKRITERVSPRVFKVVALSAPSEREQSQMYIQRYVPHFPAAREVVIFDRSWYNRAGVERVLGFCTPEESERFMELLPAVEKAMVDSGILLLKYWLEVGEKEQTRRLQRRIDDPRKIWKLSDMDLLSYSRWYDYSRARDAMFAATHTPWAPWYVAETDDKMRGRLNIIKHILSQVPYEPMRAPEGRPAETPAPEGLRGARAARDQDPDALLIHAGSMRLKRHACQSSAMDIEETFITANSALTDLVLRVQPEHLALEVPAYARFHDGQTLRTSLNLMAYENLGVPKVLAGEAGLATNPEFDGDLLGDDLPGNYGRLASEANEAVRDHADLEQIVHMSYADEPASRYLSDISLNRTMALYDAAALTGLEPRLSDDAIRSIHAIATENGELLPKMGIFPPEITVTGDADPKDRFLAFYRPTAEEQVRARWMSPDEGRDLRRSAA